jgi:hypothetical protein
VAIRKKLCKRHRMFVENDQSTLCKLDVHNIYAEEDWPYKEGGFSYSHTQKKTNQWHRQSMREVSQFVD